MKLAKRKLVLIFTRDFNHWVNEFVWHNFVSVFPKLWGKSLKDQVYHYDGKATKWLRYEDEVASVKAYMVKKPLYSPLFTKSTHLKFRKNVDALRRLISINPKKNSNDYEYLKKIKQTASAVYPYYSLSVYFPGSWRDEFLAHHKNQIKKAQAVVDLTFASRHHSEGVLKELGDFMRVWLGSKLAKNNYPKEYVKLLSMSETDTLLKIGMLPALEELRERAKGYIFFGGKLHVTSNYKKFFSDNHIILDEHIPTEIPKQFSGTVAYAGGRVTGKVCKIFNSAEVKNFKSGHILVTPMTAPDFLPAMKKARAIITDEGGLTCHAAIVARELKIPTIIGTQFASKILQTGDLVEVNATKGTIKKL